MDEKILKIFRPEAKEYLQKLNEKLLVLEKNPLDESAMEEILRVAHSLKGTAAMVGAKKIAEIAHKTEDILNEVKEKNIEDISSVCGVIFEGFDFIERVLEGENIKGDDIISRLKKVAEDLVKQGAGASEGKAKTSKSEKNKPAKTKVPSLDMDDTVRVSVEKVTRLMNLVGETLLNWQKLRNYSEELRTEINYVVSHKVPEIARHQESLNNIAKTYRENIGKLDSTLNVLQDVVMSVRMLPVSTVFSLMPRVVHDIAIEYEKKVEFEIKGEHTEIDKRMIEHLKDPLVHIIRNSIYHGIEAPEERSKKNKPESGKITLLAYQKGDRVCIEVKDDGRGIDPEVIRQAAVKKGFMDKKAADELSDEDVFRLIFSPGFSSREGADSVSGRGVGLDVVKKNIEEKLVGQVMVETERDRGTTFSLVLPLTLLINSGLLVEAGGQKVVFLINAIETVAYINPDEIQSIEGELAVKIRDYTVPLLALQEVLGIEAKGKNVFEQAEFPVIVVGYAGQKLAFAVSRLIEQKDVVIKTLTKPVGKLKNVAGVTILDSGLPAVILHIPDLMDTAKHKDYISSAYISARDKTAKKLTKRRVLIAEDSATTRDLEKKILETSGYEVDAVVDGEKAYSKLTSAGARYDLLLTDIQMPKLDGLQLCKKIKADEKLNELPVVIVTTLGNEEDKQRGLEAGADAYISKGEFNQPEVVDTIERLIGESE